jgi:hypothetical protein
MAARPVFEDDDDTQETLRLMFAEFVGVWPTAADAARALGPCAATVSRWISGEVKVNWPTVRAIAWKTAQLHPVRLAPRIPAIVGILCGYPRRGVSFFGVWTRTAESSGDLDLVGRALGIATDSGEAVGLIRDAMADGTLDSHERRQIRAALQRSIAHLTELDVALDAAPVVEVRDGRRGGVA